MGLPLRCLYSSQFRHLPLQRAPLTYQSPDGTARNSERAQQHKGADVHACSRRRLRQLAVGLRLAAPWLLRVAAVHVSLFAGGESVSMRCRAASPAALYLGWCGESVFSGCPEAFFAAPLVKGTQGDNNFNNSRRLQPRSPITSVDFCCPIGVKIRFFAWTASLPMCRPSASAKAFPGALREVPPRRIR